MLTYRSSTSSSSAAFALFSSLPRLSKTPAATSEVGGYELLFCCFLGLKRGLAAFDCESVLPKGNETNASVLSQLCKYYIIATLLYCLALLLTKRAQCVVFR